MELEMLAIGGKTLRDQKVSYFPFGGRARRIPLRWYVKVLGTHSGGIAKAKVGSYFVFSHSHSPSVTTASRVSLECNGEPAARP